MGSQEVFQWVSEYGKQKAADYGKQKANEMLDDQAKFQATLDKVAQDKKFQDLKAKWIALSEKDKEKVYKGGKQDLWAIKWSLPTLYGSRWLNGMELLAPGQTFTSFFRLAVHLGLLAKPQSVSEEALVTDMQSDFKYINTKLKAFEAIATVIPVLKPLAPVIEALRGYIQKFGATGAQALVARQSTEKTANQTYPPHQAAKEETALETNIKTGKVKQEINKQAA